MLWSIAYAIRQYDQLCLTQCKRNRPNAHKSYDIEEADTYHKPDVRAMIATTYHESIISPRQSVDTIFEVSDVGGLKERLEAAHRKAFRRGNITRTHRAAATLRDAVRGDAPCRRSFRL